MGWPAKGRADFLALGSNNVECSLCGRKRKDYMLEKNWQGFYRCPEHNEPRQPQDFVRNVKDIITPPISFYHSIDDYVQVGVTFPLKILPNPLVLQIGLLVIQDENGQNILDENGLTINSESGLIGFAQAITPPWVQPTSWLWSWTSGGVGITLLGATAELVNLLALAGPVSGVLQCIVTNNLGGTAIATVAVNG